MKSTMRRTIWVRIGRHGGVVIPNLQGWPPPGLKPARPNHTLVGMLHIIDTSVNAIPTLSSAPRRLVALSYTSPRVSFRWPPFTHPLPRPHRRAGPDAGAAAGRRRRRGPQVQKHRVRRPWQGLHFTDSDPTAESPADSPKPSRGSSRNTTPWCASFGKVSGGRQRLSLRRGGHLVVSSSDRSRSCISQVWSSTW